MIQVLLTIKIKIMKQLKRFNLKSSTTLETNEMKFILGGSTTTKGSGCITHPENEKQCSGDCVIHGLKGTCVMITEHICGCSSSSGEKVTESPAPTFIL